MRRLIAMALSLLCIALPLRSIAVVGGEHCPRMQAQLPVDAQPRAGADTRAHHHADMQSAMHAGIDNPAAAPAGHDCCCCDGAANFHGSGQLCKMGQECSPPMSYLLPPAALQFSIATRQTVVTERSTTLHTRPPAAVWRPPSLG